MYKNYSEEKWIETFDKIYNKVPTSLELEQFKKHYLRPQVLEGIYGHKAEPEDTLTAKQRFNGKFFRPPLGKYNYRSIISETVDKKIANEL